MCLDWILHYQLHYLHSALLVQWVEVFLLSSLSLLSGLKNWERNCRIASSTPVKSLRRRRRLPLKLKWKIKKLQLHKTWWSSWTSTQRIPLLKSSLKDSQSSREGAQRKERGMILEVDGGSRDWKMGEMTSRWQTVLCLDPTGWCEPAQMSLLARWRVGRFQRKCHTAVFCVKRKSVEICAAKILCLQTSTSKVFCFPQHTQPSPVKCRTRKVTQTVKCDV